MKDDQMLTMLKKKLFSQNLASQKSTLKKWQPTSGHIIQALSKSDAIEVSEIDAKEDQVKIEEVTKELVCENVLRYTVDGLITWHGRPQQQQFRIT